MTLKSLKEKGDCETCNASIDVVLYELHGMKMCEACVTTEQTATAKAVEANTMIQSSRTTDETIELKMDVFNATTVSAQEVMAAIQHDDAIPEVDKNFVMAQECLKRFKHLQTVIFEQRQELLAKENEMRAWQTQVHTFAGKVENARKEAFRNFDVSYQPKIKTVKPKAAVVTPKKFSKTELFDASKKYNVPMAAVQMIATQRNLNAEEAAKTLAGLLGKQ